MPSFRQNPFREITVITHDRISIRNLSYYHDVPPSRLFTVLPCASLVTPRVTGMSELTGLYTVRCTRCVGISSELFHAYLVKQVVFGQSTCMRHQTLQSILQYVRSCRIPRQGPGATSCRSLQKALESERPPQSAKHTTNQLEAFVHLGNQSLRRLV